MLVVDSTVWIDYFNGMDTPQVEFLNRALEQIPILVGDLIVIAFWPWLILVLPAFFKL